MEFLREDGFKLQGKASVKIRMGIYKCPDCTAEFRCSMVDARRGHTTRCGKCAKTARGNTLSKIAADCFIQECAKIHGQYTYENMEYVRNNMKVNITCPVHGSFWQRPSNHKNGQGCPKCGLELRKKDENAFVAEANKVHSKKYQYHKTIYEHCMVKVTITCPMHGDFTQTPRGHLTGRGCSKCAIKGFNPLKAAILYYLRVDVNGTVGYKIGITNRKIKDRYSTTDLKNITVVKEWAYACGSDAAAKEKEILLQYNSSLAMGTKLLQTGNTEIFTTDVLGLDGQLVSLSQPYKAPI